MYNSIQRQKMPALRREEPPANFNAVLVNVQHQWMKALLSLEDDVLVLNFEHTYAFNDEYGDHGSRPRPQEDGIYSGPRDAALMGQKRLVKIVKDESDGLGISIKGGKENKMPVVISKIFEGLAADKTGQLHCGDAILSCNGFDLSQASHDDCVQALRQAGSVVILEVQFFQEAGPQCRKHFALRDVGWELPHGFLKDAVSCPSRNLPGDVKTIPLLLCYLSRLVEQSLECDATVLLLQSPNLRTSCQLKFSDPTNGTSWFNMIHSNISALNQKLLAQCNRVLPKVLGGSHLATIGWMAERVHMDGHTQLKPVFAALTDKQFMVFDSVPWTKDEWATPGFSCELIATRVLHSPTGSRNNTISRIPKPDAHPLEPPTFEIRIGTRHGIEYHMFRLETCRDLSSWVKSVIQGTFSAVELTQDVSWGCGWQGREAKLTLHYENGFILMSGSSSRREIFWQQPFEKLRSTHDDGKRLLYLEFIDSTEPYAIDLRMSPKPVVFVIHSFLATRLNRIGLIF